MAAAARSMSAVLRAQRRYSAAAARALEALTIARRASIAAEECQSLLELGETARLRRDFAAAREALAEGERMASTYREIDSSWRLAFAAGRVEEDSGRLPDAVSAYERAAKVIETVRSSIRERRFRSGYMDDKGQVFVALVRLHLKLARPDRAFQASERLRAYAIAPIVSGAVSAAASAKLQELRARIQQLQSAVEQENAKPGAERHARAAELFTAKLISAERSWQELQDQSAAESTAMAMTVDEVQQSLPPDTGLLEYVVGEDRVMILLVTRTKIASSTSRIPADDLNARISLLRDLVSRPESERWTAPAAALAGILLTPVAERLSTLRKLYIVPDGALNYVPYAILPLGSDGRPLVGSIAVAQLPAASWLRAGAPRPPPADGLLAIAPASAHLRHATEEVRAAAELWPANSMTLVGRQATESAVTKAAGGFGVLHFATHGTFDRLNPLFSALQLEPADGADGRLEVHEIIRMRLNVGLVTLSACETALGTGYFSDVPSGGEFIGLTGAFLVAGARSVLATLWRIDDAATVQFMREYYRRVRTEGKSRALASTQRHLQSIGLYAHPYYWAAFVLIGDMN
jgi:CHAT domain-containing protein